jgi:hypothetical protein
VGRRRQWFTVVPLLNIHGHLEPLELGRVLLTPFTAAEKTMFWQALRDSPTILSAETLSEARYKLTPLNPPTDIAGGFDTQFQSDSALAISALRLASPGDIGSPGVVSVRTAVSPLGALTAASWSSDLRPPTYPRRPYVLSENQRSLLTTISDRILGLRETGRIDEIDLPLRRFNSSYTRDTGEDRIIDLAIALESSLLVGIREELKFRLALRGAALLRARRDPQETFAVLQTIYDVRSAIVHDGKSLSHMNSAFDLPDRCEDLVRDVLTEYVASLLTSGSVSSMNKALDKTILSGLTDQ